MIKQTVNALQVKAGNDQPAFNAGNKIACERDPKWSKSATNITMSCEKV